MDNIVPNGWNSFIDKLPEIGKVIKIGHVYTKINKEKAFIDCYEKSKELDIRINEIKAFCFNDNNVWEFRYQTSMLYWIYFKLPITKIDI